MVTILGGIITMDGQIKIKVIQLAAENGLAILTRLLVTLAEMKGLGLLQFCQFSGWLDAASSLSLHVAKIIQQGEGRPVEISQLFAVNVVIQWTGTGLSASH